MTEVELKDGRLRNVAEIDPGRMTIGFYKKKGAFSVSGNMVDDYVISLACDGSKWDVIADAPGFSQSIHFSPKAVESIAPPETRLALMKRLQGPKSVQAIVFPSTVAGEELRQSIEGCIRRAEKAAVDGEDLLQLAWATEDLMTAAACLIDEFTENDSFLTPAGRKNRHLVALEIEQLLWINPTETADTPKSIDDFAKYFNCSRRRIQQIVEEQFGVGFVVWKRSIRLQQAYAALASKKSKDRVGVIALEYEFENHGRFARYFQDIFGKKPSSLRNGPADSNRFR